MRAPSARIFVLILLALGAGLQIAPAQAQRVPSRALREVREKLREYEAEPALAAVTSLTRMLRGRSRLGPNDRAEARFLRALTAADLLLLSGHPGWGSLDARVAQALGVRAGAARSHVEAELRALDVGRFARLARDARAALSGAALGPGDEQAGPRLDLTRLLRVAAALEDDDPIGQLSRLAADPCEPGPCEEGLSLLSPRSRRALRAFIEGLGAAARLDLAIEFGDPFSRAIEPEIHRLGAGLARARLNLRPRAEPGLGRVSHGEGADVFVTVTEGSFIVQGAAIYALREGEVGPISPERCRRRVEIPLPASFGARIAAVRELSRALPRECGDRVAVAAEDEVSADLVLRVIASVRAAGLSFAGLAGVDASGELVVRELRLAQAKGGAEVGVRGHHLVVRGGGAREHIPLEALASPGESELERLARVLDGARSSAPLKVSGDVPFVALRVILRALEGPPAAAIAP